jgi:hypothetical protein
MKKILIILLLLIACCDIFAQPRAIQRIGLTTLRDSAEYLTVDRQVRFPSGLNAYGTATFFSPIVLSNSGMIVNSGNINLVNGAIFRLDGTDINSIFAKPNSSNTFTRKQNLDTLSFTNSFNLNSGSVQLLEVTPDGSWLADHYDFYTKGVKRASIDGDSNKIKIYSGANQISLWNNNGVLDINAPIVSSGGLEVENMTVTNSIDLSGATITGLPTDTNTYLRKYGDDTKSGSITFDVIATNNIATDNDLFIHVPDGEVSILAANEITLDGSLVIVPSILIGSAHLSYSNDKLINDRSFQADTLFGNYMATGTAQYKVLKTSPVTVANDTIHAASGTVFTKTLSGNSTFKLAGLSDGQSITFAVTNTVSNYTVSWSALGGLNLYWPGNSVPVQTTGNHVDLYTFKRIGNDIFGSVVQNYK